VNIEGIDKQRLEELLAQSGLRLTWAPDSARFSNANSLLVFSAELVLGSDGLPASLKFIASGLSEEQEGLSTDGLVWCEDRLRDALEQIGIPESHLHSCLYDIKEGGVWPVFSARLTKEAFDSLPSPRALAGQVRQKETEGELVYKLGNGQWDIPALRKLLEDILPKNTFFKGFEVTHVFPSIGRKVIILNARQIHFKEEADCEPIIMLAMEDVTDIMLIAEKLAAHTNEFESDMAKRAEFLENQFKELAEEVGQIKKREQISTN